MCDLHDASSQIACSLSCRLRASRSTTASSENECPSEVSTVGRDSEAAECADKAGRGNYLRLAIANSKADKHSLERHLPAALEFVSGHLAQQRRVLIHCDAGQLPAQRDQSATTQYLSQRCCMLMCLLACLPASSAWASNSASTAGTRARHAHAV